MEQNQDKINWTKLSENPNAIHLLEQNLSKIKWGPLCRNPNAIGLLKTNLKKIKWNDLSRNPNAICLLKENPEKIDWYYFATNPNAIHLLDLDDSIISRKYYYISMHILWKHPTIFKYDYLFYKKRMDICREELIKKVFHPKRLKYYLDLDYDLFDGL